MLALDTQIAYLMRPVLVKFDEAKRVKTFRVFVHTVIVGLLHCSLMPEPFTVLCRMVNFSV